MPENARTSAALASDNNGFSSPIPGLDVAAGLRRVEGDTDLYLMLLRDFIATEKSAAADIAGALARDDRIAATRRAHTVKGLAGTFCATQLYPVARALETALRDARPQDEVDARLAQFSTVLAALIGELEAALPATAEPAPIPDGPVDPRHLAAVCHELCLLLADCDMGAGRVADSHGGLLRAAFGNDDFQRLQQALRAYDFDDAAALLIHSCRRHGVALPAES